MTTRLVLAAFTVALAVVAGRSAAAAQATGVAPAAWMNSTCGAIKTLEDDAGSGSAALAASPRRSGLVRFLARASTDGLGVENATRTALPGVADGKEIAAFLHRNAASFVAFVARTQAASAGGGLAEIAATAEHVASRSRSLGVAFLQLGTAFPSSQSLAGVIDQAPTCALVHG